MTKEQFEALLFEEEGTALDFKREPYPFSGEPPGIKSELLKDILGFCNAWRRAPAFILIGVEEVRGGRSIVLGIEKERHLEDHVLQQFVNSRTNRPVDLQYRAFEYEGKQVGIICIEPQVRPIYLNENYGKLKRNAVYVRRGSSTDPQNPATPDEIAAMSLKADEQPARVEIEFAAADDSSRLGSRIALSCVLTKLPARRTIPDYGRRESVLGYELPSFGMYNRDYYRELAASWYRFKSHQPFRLVLHNAGTSPVRGARLEVSLDAGANIKLVDEEDMAPPSQTGPNIGHLIRTNQEWPGKVELESDRTHTLMAIEFGDLQPGRLIYSDVFYIGALASGTYSLEGLVYADTLPAAQAITLVVQAEVTESELSLDRLLALPDPEDWERLFRR